MNLKRFSLIVLSLFLVVSGNAFSAFAEEESYMFYVNSVNGTRWADYICVYRGIERNGQNEWGNNILVNSEGVVIEKIPSGDAKGKNLAVPEGGMIVTGTGEIGESLYNAAEVGDNCLFDEYSMRVYFSKGEIDPFYTQTLRITGYNEPRYSDTVIVYNQSGKRTGTNVYGYEVCVDSEGYIISVGGNDNVVPTGGYVISATEAKDTDVLKMYFAVGARCTLSSDSVTAKYSQNELSRTAKSELDILKSKLDTAKTQYKLIDYDAVEEAIAQIDLVGIDTLEERNAAIAKMREVEPLLVESHAVETRSVWYTPTETNENAVKATVAEMKAAGINELVLSSNNSNGSFVPFDTDEIPFRRASIARRFDVIQAYVDECRANDISIVVLVTVMGGSFAEHNKAWFDVTNTGAAREEIFFSPANAEYRKAFMDYVSFIVTNYDIDGLQLDYIRYPEFHGGVDAGYDDATIALFEEKTGYGADVVEAIGKQLTKHPQWKTWWSFKTELINGWVEEIYGMVTELRPDIYITAAVAGNNNVSTYCQDPFAWIKGGYIDGVYVMSYVEEINQTSVAPHVTARTDKSYVVMGCGAYLSISNQSIVEQTDNSMVLGADGTGYFEWSAVKAHQYTELFKSSLFSKAAIPFTADTTEVVDKLVATAKARVELYCAANSAAAADLRAIMSSLPDNGADKAALTSAINALASKLDGDAEKLLTADFYSAVRALNMDKPEYEFVKHEREDEESEPDKSDKSSRADEESQKDESSESVSDTEEQKGESKFPIVPIAIGGGVAVIAAVAALIVVLKKKKK